MDAFVSDLSATTRREFFASRKAAWQARRED
jgi:hypothetical protein